MIEQITEMEQTYQDVRDGFFFSFSFLFRDGNTRCWRGQKTSVLGVL